MKTSAQSELVVITKVKDLCSYVFTITDKSPKRFRFTLVSKLQMYTLDTMENLFRANEVYIGNRQKEKAEERLYNIYRDRVARRLVAVLAG